jgi:MGT family glycosyltransferase
MTQNTYDIAYMNIAQIAKPGKRILFANVPADGHFKPLTGLAVCLQSKGYDVRWYGSSIYEDKIRKLNIPYYPFEKALDANQTNFEEVFPERRKHKGQISKLNFDMVNVFILRSTEYYADMLEIHKTFPFDLVITDCVFSAIPFIKEKMGLPVIAIGVLPLTETSKDIAPAGLGLTPSNTFFGKLKQAALRFLAAKVLFKKSDSVMKKLLEENGIDHEGAFLFDILVRKSTLLLQSGTPGFEYKRSDLSKNVRFIGPLLPYSVKKNNERWYNKKLEQYNNVILVTQGTVEKDPGKIIVPTLEAFKNSRHLVIATTGGSQTEELKARYPQENIIIEDFIPFEDVMPYADVYITNGGYGGVMLAVQHELPMVVAGVHEGKNEINARVGYFKLGVNLGTEKPAAAQIRKSVEEVISNNIYRSNVKKLSEEFCLYNPQKLCASYVADILNPALPYKQSAFDNKQIKFAEN